MRSPVAVCVGTAGWSIPRALASGFRGEGTHLHRYAAVLSCAEINTSFYRDHSFSTYAKWAAATPPGFRFAVKLPQLITHELELRRSRAPLHTFLAQVAGLGKKLGPLLIQLPPSLHFNARGARAFMEMLRSEYAGAVVIEPRHASWFEPKVEALLMTYRISRVATDPTGIEDARVPGGWYSGPRRPNDALAYFRLHGAPRKYWSRYDLAHIQRWAAAIAELSSRTHVWCVFDNTASGAALSNALEMKAQLETKGARRPAGRRRTSREQPG